MSSKKIYLTVILSFSILIVFAQSHEKPKNLKLITYNIWNGFEWGKDTIRQANMIDWIQKKSPDVLALQELNDFNQEKLAREAKKWGHNYALILKESGYPVGITSRYPIELKERIIENMHHGALHCKTAGIDFFIVHLSPFQHIKRHKEAKIILDKLSKITASQDKYIVLGDFNAVSPLDAHLYKGNKELITEMKKSEEKHSHVRNLLQENLEYGVISSFLSFPLIDVTQLYTDQLEQRISYPTQVFEKKRGEGRSIHSTRIDYILVSPKLAAKCTNAGVYNQKGTFYLSDHYPVYSEFKF